MNLFWMINYHIAWVECVLVVVDFGVKMAFYKVHHLCKIVPVRFYNAPVALKGLKRCIQTVIAVESLSITISDGQLVATNADGTQSFALTDLSKMYFTQQADLTGISNAGTQEDEVVEVFTTGGIKLGKYLNINEAKSSLKPGLYILKSKQKSFKIVVK